MNNIFGFLDYDILYRRCMLASIAHAIMVGKYNLLTAEQSWDHGNYNFQNMEGVRGVISFKKGTYICVIQNSADYDRFIAQLSPNVLYGAEKKFIDLAKEEALQYMLIEHNDKKAPFISTAFWGDEKINYSNHSEKQIIEISEKLIMPFLYSEVDAKKYWIDYYEMSDEQTCLMESIYERRINIKGRIRLTSDEKSKLREWFGDINDCMESFQEVGIV